MDKDFVRDQNPTPIYHADSIQGMPQYVKEAKFLTVEDIESLHSAAFADRVKRLHPIHTKVAALLSGVYLAGKGVTEGPVWDNVKSACDFYNVSEDLGKLVATFTQVKEAHQVEEKPEAWAVHVKWNEEQEGHYYPINTAAEIKEAAVALDQDFNRNRIPLELFRAGAINVVKAAKVHGVSMLELPRVISDVGILRLPNLEYADTMLYTRKAAGVPDEGIEVYKLCIDMAKEAGTDEAVAKAVDFWKDLDEQHGLSYRKQANGAQLPTPYDCFYTGMTVEELEKTAQAHVVLHGVMVPVADFVYALGLDTGDTDTIYREFNKEAADKVASACMGNGSMGPENYAIEVSSNLSELPEWQQKRLLGIVRGAYKEAAVAPTAPAPAQRGIAGLGAALGALKKPNMAAPTPSPTTPTPTIPQFMGPNLPDRPGTHQRALEPTQPVPRATAGLGGAFTALQQPNMATAGAVPPTPSPVAPVMPVSEVDWNKEFQKYHGTTFDANSTMDAGKLQQMKDIMAQHGKLTPGLVYG
jgi:hypothetical protein